MENNEPKAGVMIWASNCEGTIDMTALAKSINAILLDGVPVTLVCRVRGQATAMQAAFPDSEDRGLRFAAESTVRSHIARYGGYSSFNGPYYSGGAGETESV